MREYSVLYTLGEAAVIAQDKEGLARKIGWPFPLWAHRCHAVSISLVRSGAFGVSRVARGWAAGVSGQHSWIVLGMNCYDEDAVIVDPTLWSYSDKIEGISVRAGMGDFYRPHGAGSIWQSSPPVYRGGPVIELAGKESLSPVAHAFLACLGPMDQMAWFALANAPVGGWPAEEIFGAMYDTPALRALVPIDIVGMVTDRNPGGMYLRGES